MGAKLLKILFILGVLELYSFFAAIVYIFLLEVNSLDAKQLYEIAEALRMMSEQIEAAANDQSPSQEDIDSSVEIIPSEDIRHRLNVAFKKMKQLGMNDEMKELLEKYGGKTPKDISYCNYTALCLEAEEVIRNAG